MRTDSLRDKDRGVDPSQELYTTVITEDLWAALDALDAVPEAQQTEWYKRLEEAADAATQVMLLDKGLITRQ